MNQVRQLTEATRIAARCELFFSLLYCALLSPLFPCTAPRLPCSTGVHYFITFHDAFPSRRASVRFVRFERFGRYGG